MGCIVERLTVSRPKKRVGDKLLELGLIQDKKELRKKRSKKSEGEGRNRSGTLLLLSVERGWEEI